jgi:exosortase
VATEVGSPAVASLGGARRFAVASAVGTCVLAVVVYAPVLYYMVLHWRDVPDYSHGFVIAPLAVYFAWERRRALERAPIEPSWWGLVPLSFGALALAVGRLGVELMSMRTGFVLTLIGLVLLLLGRRVFRILAFPLCFLFLMVPLPQSLVNVVAFPLQLLAADLAVKTLQFLGEPVLREGNIIHLPNAPLFVAQACSGLRSLMALGTLGVVFAYFFRKTWGERLILVASTLPIAVLVNAFRVLLTAALTYRYGPAMAEGVIHQTEGFFTFGLAFGLLLIEARLLAWLWPRRKPPAAQRVPA